MDVKRKKNRVEIFCCYAHKDQLLLTELKNHLKLWEHLQLITIWTDTDISPGTNWQKEIMYHLNSAQIILLLISPDFLASEYCFGTEITHAMKRFERGEACVIPIILRSCAWEEASFGQLQALPTDAKPIDGPGWHTQDEALTDVAKGLRKIITTIASRSIDRQTEVEEEIRRVINEEIDREAILHYEKQYREQVGQRYSRITPPNFDRSRSYPIDDLYIFPSFMTTPQEGEEAKLLNKDEFLAHSSHVVLLGNPGGGKSTFTLKLCYDLATGYSQSVFAGRKELTPILVLLRNYGADKKERKCSIQEFIETEAKTLYQLPTPPNHTFQYLLLAGRAMVIFDGLDELLDTSYRQEIRSDVESFCHLYPSVPILVTSREVGYEQAPLNEFEVFRINEFDRKQVDEYVEKWFDIADSSDLTEPQRRAKAKAFLRESKIVPDLCSNPLMLALLCTIYREENYIPRYRPDVYEKCTLMLFERWDKGRSLYHPPLAEEHVRPLMAYLAYWIYGNDQLRAGVTEEELLTEVTEYVHEWIYEHIHKAESAAHAFIKFCTGRAWVFTDTGTRKNGENLYQFAHTTFLEYFAATHLVRTCRTPEALLKVLGPRIVRREWDVMAQLAFQIQHKKNIGAGDELLMDLVEQSSKNTGDRGWNELSFAIRCLQFIVPRPEVRRYVVEVCVKRCIAWGCEQIEKANLEKADCDKGHQPPQDANLRKVVESLSDATYENRTTIVDTLQDLLVEHVKSDREVEALMALEIASILRPNFQKVEERIFTVCIDRIAALYPQSILLSEQALWSGRIHVSDFIRWHGIECLFHMHFYKMFPSSAASSSFHKLVSYILYTPTITGKTEAIYQKILKTLGNVLLPYSLPWLKGSIGEGPLPGQAPSLEINTINAEALFSVFIVLALLLESEKVWANRNFRDEFVSAIESKLVRDQRSSFDFYLILLARFKPQLISKVQAELDQYGFTAEQQHFIHRWIRHEINLTA